MPAQKKYELVYAFDDDSPIKKWIEWYEVAKTDVKVNPETGKSRKRKGPAKKVLKEFLETIISNGGPSSTSKEQKLFLDSLEEYKEVNKLPKEMQEAKTFLSEEEYKIFLKHFEKIQKEKEKIQ